ncbi:MAG: hypothetical protein ABI417_00260, partial [Coleofasciculaceae cyanobacterium]
MTQQISDSQKGKLSLSQSSNLVKQVIGKPLTIITNPSGDYAIAAGETFELRVTISNQGNQGALIDIFIDETSGLLRQWCASPDERLALGSDHSGEVVFRFQVPPQAIPDTYSYLLIIDAPAHYPEDTPIRHEARLQVLPPVQLAVRVNDPTFTTLPITSSTKPAVIQPGQSLPFRVLVNNRSDRVDRFRLTCTDIPEDWFTVICPEGISELGLVIEADSLDLNPGAKNEILLQFNFPLNITAGYYSPTLRLTSINNLDLVLMDVIYLQVLPVHNLEVELQTVIGNVKRQPGRFQIIATNAGNTVREIIFRPRGDSEEQLCTYSLKPARVSLRPKEIARTDLQVKPTKWWRRPWFGKGLRIKYYLDLEDTYQLPLAKKTFEGTLVWEARPWWQLVGVILLGVGIIAALVFLIWWLFFRPLTPPKIVEFSSEVPSYQEANRDFIYLRWQIRHPEQLRTLRIVEQSPNDGTTNNSQPVSYDFSQGIPNQLKKFCTLNDVLTCRDVRTDARQKGSYVFAMEVFSKKEKDTASDTRKTNIIKIEPTALPKIVEFEPTAPTYQEANNQSSSADFNNIRLNWKIINPFQMQELRLIGRAPDGSVNSRLTSYNFSTGIPDPLKQFCILQATLICRNVPTDARKAGDYIFELSVVPKQSDSEAIASQKTDTIKIQAKQTPFKIVFFQINGQEAPPQYLVPLNPPNPSNQKDPVKNSFLSWKVEGDKDLKVELLPAPGTVPIEGKIPLSFLRQPGVEVFTLQVTNASGQQIKRSVSIETFIPFIPPKPPKKDAKASSPSPTSTSSPSPTSTSSPSPTSTSSPSPTS